MNENYNLEFYKEKLETDLDIKKLLFYKKNQIVLQSYLSRDKSKELTLEGKSIEDAILIEKILHAFDTSYLVDLYNDTITEDILINRIKDGYIVEIKNGFSIYTFELGQENIYCTINGDSEHAYYMKDSCDNFGRMKGGIEKKYKSFKDIIDSALTKGPSKLELLQSSIDTSLEKLASKLDAPETAIEIEKYLKNMSIFHNYSFNNQMLISIAAKERGMSLERVASFNTWKKLKDSNGKNAIVAKGEKGLPVVTPIEYIKYKRDDSGKYILNKESNKIPIINPATGKVEKGLKFTAGFVFDINQLANAKEIKEVLSLEYRDNSIDIEDEAVENLLQNISKTYSVAIRYEDIRSGANAYYSLEKDEIVLSTKLQSNAHKISSLFHELGHKIMHSDLDYEAIHSNRGSLEGEAEAFSKILSNLYGIDNRSELYINTWGNSADDLRLKLEKISTTAMEAVKTLGLDSMQKSISAIAKEQKQVNERSQTPTSDRDTRKSIEAIAELAKKKSINKVKPSVGYADVAI